MTLRTALFLAALATGCAIQPGPIVSSRAGNAEDVRQALAGGRGTRAATPVNATGAPLLFAVGSAAGGGAQLIAFDLQARRVLWRQPANVAARVAVSRAIVVHATPDGRLLARDVRSGAVRWEKALDPKLVRIGYAADEDGVYEVVEPAGTAGVNKRPAFLVAYDAASGSRRFRQELVGPAGAPAAGGGVVAVPRQSQYVTLYDARSGRQQAEILSRQEAATFVHARPEGLLFGSRGVYRAGPATANGERDTGEYLASRLPAFVRPQYGHDFYRVDQAGYSALDRNRLLWRVAGPPGRAAFAADTVVVHHFRFFFGVDPGSGGLRWAHNHPRHDAMASEHTGPAILYVTSDGEVHALDARTGRPRYRATLAGDGPLSIEGATFDAEGFAGAGEGGAAGTLVESLSSIVWDGDRRFSDVKLFAVEALAALPGPEVTRELLKALDASDVVPAPVFKVAMDALVARQDRSMLDLYIEALKVHPDYAEDRKPKRLEIFARAVTRLKAREAIPALVDHLRLPDTDPEMVRDIADAVLATEAKEALEPFQDFLIQYRADPIFDRRPGALLAACEVLLRLGGAPERALLLFVAEEPRTVAPVASYLQRQLFGDARR